MKFKIVHKPVYTVEISNVFSKEVNQEILHEAISLEEKFESATVDSKLLETFRDNLIYMPDDTYKTKKHILNLIQNQELGEVLSSSPYPFSEYLRTTKHESQVSRYGYNQHYDWHVDRFKTQDRILTFIYYFNVEPKHYSGGQIQLTNSPTIAGKLVDENPEILSITPKNNMGLIISANTPHRVCATLSPKEFKFGRFSINCFIGDPVG